MQMLASVEASRLVLAEGTGTGPAPATRGERVDRLERVRVASRAIALGGEKRREEREERRAERRAERRKQREGSSCARV